MKKSMKLIMLCALVGFLSGGSLLAQSPKFNLVDGQPIHTQTDLDSLQNGDTVVAYCPVCKGMTMTTYSSDPSSPGHVKLKQVCKKDGATLELTSFRTAQK